METLQRYWNGFFKEKIFFTYARCIRCGLLFCPAFFTAGQLRMLYSQMPDNTAGLPLRVLHRTQRGYYDILRGQSTRRGGYLELGPDIGLFTEHAIEHDLYDEYWLFEPNRAVWPTLEKQLGGKKHHLRSEMFDLSTVPDRSITVAVMIHVLDHLLDPADMLKQLRMKLRADGVLLLITHDESSALAKLTSTRWPAYCLQHPQLYNPTSMRNTLSLSGFTVVNTTRTVNHFPVMYLAKHLLWALGIRSIDVPLQDKYAIPLKLGNIATLATLR